MKNLTIKSTTHRKGHTTEAYVSKAVYGDTHITTTYDVLNENLIIDKWYMFGKDELEELRKALTEHFKKTIA